MVKLECIIISMICELVNQGLSEQVQDSSDTRALFLRGDDHGGEEMKIYSVDLSIDYYYIITTYNYFLLQEFIAH